MGFYQVPTRPGYHSTTSFNAYPKALMAAIRVISKSFYITRSFSAETVGNSEYWGIVARPAEEYSVHLNADRELLFVFSQYENFEIRTIEAFDLFYDQLEQKRVDRSIRFLISSDRKIEEKIQHYLNQNPEYPIIIPIYLNDINSSGARILDAIRRNYVLRDLFGYQNPLREETFFFGRQEQVTSVLDLAKSGQSSSIFGLRKSGKTSTIYAIIRRARSFGISPVFIDCQSPVVHARRYNELLSYVVAEARKAIGHTKPLKPLDGSAAKVAEEFHGQMKTVLGQAKSSILLIFDEIENISPETAASKHWEEGEDSLLFWQTLRSFIQQDASGRLGVCLVGTSPLLLERPEINGVANPMYLFSQKRFLPSLSFEDTKLMIERLGFFMGLEFAHDQIAKLQTTYGGHPFFIRQVCSNVNQISTLERPVKVSERILGEAIDKFGHQLGSYLTDILGNLDKHYPAEFGLLKAVTFGDRNEISEYGTVAPELIDHLIGYGIVEKRGDDFDIRFDAIRIALKALFQADKLEDFWKECMLRRNKLEVGIRSELFYVSKSLSANSWDSFLKQALSKSRYEKLPSNEPRALFSRGESPLYWSDLIAIMKSADVFKYLEERRSELISAMNVVNESGRKDAHAKALSSETMEELRAAFSILENEFLQPE